MAKLTGRTMMVLGLLYALSGFVTVASAGVLDPVVFVHGFKGDGSNWDTMKSKLIGDGWPADRLFAITFIDNTGSNITNANQLNAYVNDVLVKSGASKVDMVLHSMGGLSSRYYIKNLGGGSKVDRYIDLDSPNHGCYCSTFPGEGGKEMTVGSAFLASLNSGTEIPSAPFVRYTTIWSNFERSMPDKSPELAGAENIYKPTTCHICFLKDAGIYALVKELLAN